jgi:hypothetical protein
VAVNGICTVGSQCCSKSCNTVINRCRAPLADGGVCLASGISCTASNQCCSQVCRNSTKKCF